jgi:protocatechuate 3,4-dioxygenase, alpha subunit
VGVSTPSQTIGPFFAVMAPLGGNELVQPGNADAITISGRVFDGEGSPVPDALIEVWQANRGGRYRHPADAQEKLLEDRFTGFGRCYSGPQGEFRFVTVKPGTVPGSGDAIQAPHINVGIFARGLLKRLATRIYFPDEPANDVDPVLCSIADAAVRVKLFAARTGPSQFEFNIHLQGERETAFFVY